MLIDKITSNFNFDEKEAKVYLANLSLGKSRVSEIAHKAQLNRITAYEILKRLRLRGIASSSHYKNITYFNVIPPEQVIKKMERQVELSKKILPQLLIVKNQNKNRPKVEYYDGAEGIKAIYEDTLSCQEKVIYNIAHPTNLLKTVKKDFFQNYVKKRVRKKIKVKVLIPDESKFKLNYIKESKNTLREIKTFDNKQYPIPNEIMIYDNKVALLSFSDKIGVIIENTEINQSLKTIWQILWDSKNN